MTQPSGWYDDPADPSRFRYWDGMVWSSQVAPKVSAMVAEQGAEQPGYGQQSGYGQQPELVPQTAYGQQPAWKVQPPTTPDGVPLAGWWQRVGARLLDGLFLLPLTLPFTGWFYYRYFTGIVDRVKDLDARAAAANDVGTTPVVDFPWGLILYPVAAAIIATLVAGAYEVFFLIRSGATPGKKILGISVRLRDTAGPMPMKTVLGRAACEWGFRVVGGLSTLDVLWPLWDDKKQALHDKVVGTNVVVGRQAKRDA